MTLELYFALLGPVMVLLGVHNVLAWHLTPRPRSAYGGTHAVAWVAFGATWCGWVAVHRQGLVPDAANPPMPPTLAISWLAVNLGLAAYTTARIARLVARWRRRAS